MEKKNDLYVEYPIDKRSIGAILKDTADRYEDRIFFYYHDDVCTYRQLCDRASQFAAGLVDLGVQKGGMVCNMMHSTPDYLYMWFGLSMIGGVEVPINTAYKSSLLEYLINYSGAEILIIENEFLDRIKLIEDKLTNLKKLIVHSSNSKSDFSNPTRFEVLPFETVFTNVNDVPDVEVNYSDLCSIVFTSGTTGPSKGAMLPVNFIYRLATRHADIMRYEEKDVLYNFLPFYHVAGKFQTLAAMLVGGKIVLQEKFSLDTFWDNVKKYGVTGFLAVGGIPQMLYSRPRKKDDAENPLKKVYSVPRPKEIQDDFEMRFGVRMMEAYGATEDGLVLSTPWNEDVPKGSCGKAPSLYQVEIFDEKDMPCPPGVPGEIVVRPNEPYAMMTGYYKMTNETLEAFKNLWFHTGDRGVRDENGWFYFLDRKKDSLRRKGENISSYEVERVIDGHPKVSESAVVAVPSEHGEDEVKVVVVLREGESLEPLDLIKYCEDRMQYFAVPRFVEYVRELPRTPTQKVEKYKLREMGVTPSTWDREKSGYKLKR